MSIVYKTGDLLDSGCDYICHQVNCQGKMNSGIAKQIRKRWPVVYKNYLAKYNTFVDSDLPLHMMLGDIQIVGLWEDFYAVDFHQSVINLFSQEHYGYDGRRYTSYDAFWSCLGQIKNVVPKGKKIGFPYKIGCDRGGANWNVIECMIKTVLEDEYEIEIWLLA